MYARTTTVRGDPLSVDDGIDHVRGEVWPALAAMSGCVGVSMLADRDAGRCIVTAAWATDEALRASREVMWPLRSRMAEVLRADSVEVAEWDIVLVHRRWPASDGAATRVVWTRGTSAEHDRSLDAVRTKVLPGLEDLDGFCSVSHLIDRTTGAGALACTFASQEDLTRSRERAAELHAAFLPGTGLELEEVAEFSLAVAHLRVPELV